MYRKAWLSVAWAVLVFATVPFWLFGFLGGLGAPYFLLGNVLWVLHGVAACVWLRCRSCGTAIFRTGPSWFPVYTPWPHKTCRECGADQTRT